MCCRAGVRRLLALGLLRALLLLGLLIIAPAPAVAQDSEATVIQFVRVLDCGDEPAMRSIDGARPVSIRFANQARVGVSVYWLDYTGQRQFYRRLEPTQWYTQPTYASHPWIVVDDSGTCHGLYVVPNTDGPPGVVYTVGIPSEGVHVYDCDDEADLRSIDGIRPITITFASYAPAGVSIYWINYAGQRQLYRRLDPMQSYTQPTYATHPWIVVDDDGGCHGLYVVSDAAGPPGAAYSVAVP
jgi:hypothetical protein